MKTKQRIVAFPPYKLIMYTLIISLAILSGSPGTAASPAAATDESSKTSLIGERVEGFQLANCYGKQIALDDFEDSRLIVLAFLGTECPLAKLYGPKLQQVANRYGQDNVTIIGINSNRQDSLTELLAYAQRHEIRFPMLKDLGNRVADAVGATRTPEVFLLDQDRVIRYHGRIDDQYAVGVSRGTATRQDLADAVDQLLAGDQVSTPETMAIGCLIGKTKDRSDMPRAEITYTKHIAQIFNDRCVRCHRKDEIAPFTLTSFDDVLGWEDTILEVIDDNRMPPWNANPAHGTFANDARLSDAEKQLIRQWIDQGMAEGDPADLPPPPQFVQGWRIPTPDQVIQMRANAEPFHVPAEGVVDYQHFIVDPGWTEDKYISAAEARPDNRSVVHHILVYVIPPGSNRRSLEQVLVGYAPGSDPVWLDNGIAMHVKAGSRLLFEMHYTPNGTAQTDLSYAGFCFTDQDTVRRTLRGRVAINPRFRIPPGEAKHVVYSQYLSKRDELLISMTPHMHLRGKAFRYEAVFPGGEREILLDVPHYDFNWQLKYTLQQPRLLPRGTLIECRAVFDNSADNVSNPDPNREVTWGDQSFDEMMIGFMDTIDAG